jgi:hypothetical protein
LSRQNWILLVVLAAQAVILAAVLWPESTPRTDEPLIEGVERQDVVGLVTADISGRSVRLSLGSEGCVLPDIDNYPCKQEAFLELVDEVLAITRENLVAQTSDSHIRLSVSERSFERTIDLTLSDGGSRRVFLGSVTQLGSIHARAGGEDEVYRVSGIATTDAPVGPSNWIDQVYFSTPEDALLSVTVENSGGSIRFLRDAGGEWGIGELAEGEVLDTEAVDDLLSKVESMTIREPLGKAEDPSYRFDQLSALVIVRSLDEDGAEQTRTIRVGAEFEDKVVFVVKSSESEYYALVAPFGVRDFVEHTRTDLLVPPPTPTPEPTPAP